MKGLGEKCSGITPMQTTSDDGKRRSNSLSETSPGTQEWTSNDHKPSSLVIQKKPDMRIMKVEEHSVDKRQRLSHVISNKVFQLATL